MLIHSFAGGSAVCVYAENGEGLAFTARHVYQNEMGWQDTGPSTRTTIKFRDVMVRSTYVLHHTNRDVDLTAVYFTYQGTAPVVHPIADTPARGGKVIKVGYPANPDHQAPLNVKVGTVTGMQSYNVFTTAPVRSGDSGGAFLTESGQLIGIVAYHNEELAKKDGRGRIVWHEGYGKGPSTDVCRDFFKNCFPRLRKKQDQPKPPEYQQPPTPQPPAPQPPAPVPPNPDAGVLEKILEAQRQANLIQQKMLDRIDRLESQAKVPGPKGDTGPAGPKGDTGAVGPKGDAGPAGKDADESRLRALEEEIAKMKAPLVVELVGPDGKVVKKQQFGPTQPLRLQLIPVK